MPTAEERRSLAGVAVPVAFGTVVGMWGVGYLSHLPGVHLPRLALGLIVLIQVLGARAAARRHPDRIPAGVVTGVLCSLLNLFVLGSFLAEGGEEGAWHILALQALGFLLVGALLGALGAMTAGQEDPLPFDAGRAFGRIAVAATFLLVVSGGIVTSTESGLAVPDWPTSFGANMFLLPFSKMLSQSQVFYEHAHRLIGVLVGTTTAALGVFLWRTDPRRWMRGLGGVLILAVVVQAVMGGIRVRLATPEGVDTAASLAFRVAHGVTGQLFFAGVLALAAFGSRSWRTLATSPAPAASTDRRIALFLLVAAVGQLLLGALLRHISREWLLPHIGGAAVVAALAVVASVRATGLYPTCPPLRATGLALLFLVIGQVMLGFLALAVTGAEVRGASRGALETLVATVHQATGAMVLGAGTLLLIWVHRGLSGAALAAATPPPTAR